MGGEQPKNPLHGVTLEAIIETLVTRHGWPELSVRVPIRCFTSNPSVGSSLKFLRKNAWARAKVERLYLDDVRRIERNRKRKERRQKKAEHEAAALAATADEVASAGDGEA